MSTTKVLAVRYNTEYPDELCHYGVLGMKWGIRRARRKEAKSAYKKATNKAFSQYEKSIHNIEKKYKRGQTLSEVDQAREAKVESDYKTAVQKAKKAYKQAKTSHAKDADIANKLYSKQSKEANKRVAEMSTGKAIAESFLIGSYGALKHNEARGRGMSKGKSVVEGILYNAGNASLGGLLSAGQYLDNRFARKRK